MGREIIFIGAGNASEAFIAGILQDGLHHPEEMLAVEVNPARREVVEQRYGVVTVGEIGPEIGGAPIVFLAVKPQNCGAALDECSPYLAGGQRLLSIVAGRTAASIRERLIPEVRVVRAMPNLAMQVRASVTALGVDFQTTGEDLSAARRVLECVGTVIEVEEELLDAVTAVSGSGPGYVFMLMEALLEAALAEGLSAEAARILVVETFLGASKLVSELGAEPAVLRRRVCSPGGTTLAGIGVLEDSNIFGIFRHMVQAARKRATELGQETR